MLLSPRRSGLALAAALALAGCAAPTARDASQASIERVRHVVVIFAENHSFDNLYGLFPGADGVEIGRASCRERV